MDYYRVMLVDDEEEVRMAMAKRIDWEEIGFKVVATAENGEDALEKAEQTAVDVIMTDIQMPFMDGFEMLRRMKQILPGVKSVIFSGYDEFEYAKEAIKLEAEEYILKPIDAGELKQVFLRIKARLDEEIAERKNVDYLRQYYKNSIPILKEQFLIALLEGRLSADKIAKYEKEYDFNLDSAFYSVAVMKLSSISAGADQERPDQPDDLDDSLLTVSLRQMTEDALKDRINAITVNYLDTIVVIALLKNTAAHKEFIDILDKVCKLSKRLLKVGTMAGVGRVYGNTEDISISYNEAQNAISYKIFLDDSQAISIMDAEPGEDIDDYIEEKQIPRIIHEVKAGTDESLKKMIDETVGRFRNESESLSQLQFFYTDLLVELSRLARGHKLMNEAVELMEVDARTELSSCKDLSDFAGRAYERAKGLKEKLSEGRESFSKGVTDRAKQYINAHYAETDMSVEKLCGQLNVCASYFSSIFKRDVGMSFVSYLTQVRMEEAKRLLDTTDEKSYVIAGMVGYDEPNYFSYVFKKQFGVSPSKYRNA